jgi:hypothetical protein
LPFEARIFLEYEGIAEEYLAKWLGHSDARQVSDLPTSRSHNSAV